MIRNTIFILLILWVLPVSAQKNITVVESAKEMSQGLQPAFVIDIPESEIKDVERAWIKLLQKGTRERVRRDKDELKQSTATIKGVPASNLAVYTRLFADKGDVIMVCFFEIDSVFFNSEQNQDVARSIKAYMRTFALEQYRSAVMKELKTEERKAQELNRVMQNLRDEEKANEKSIKENNREIEGLKDKIEVNLRDEERKSEEIENQKDLVAAAKDNAEEKKSAEKGLKKMKRDKRKLQRRRESMHKKIDKLEEEIKRAERDIRIGQEKQRLQENEVAMQESIVNGVKDKLANIH